MIASRRRERGASYTSLVPACDLKAFLAKICEEKQADGRARRSLVRRRSTCPRRRRETAGEPSWGGASPVLGKVAVPRAEGAGPGGQGPCSSGRFKELQVDPGSIRKHASLRTVTPQGGSGPTMRYSCGSGGGPSHVEVLKQRTAEVENRRPGAQRPLVPAGPALSLA